MSSNGTDSGIGIDAAHVTTARDDPIAGCTQSRLVSRRLSASAADKLEYIRVDPLRMRCGHSV